MFLTIHYCNVNKSYTVLYFMYIWAFNICYMNNIDIVHYGSDMKLSIEPDFGDVSAASVDFSITFYIGNAQLTLKKSQLIPVNGKYIACIKAPSTARGMVRASMKVDFPDGDFSDGTHTIVEPMDIRIQVV